MRLEPLPLQTLSLEVFANHVINLLKKVNANSATTIYEYIKDLIHKKVPHIFADVVTKKLLERMCRLHHCCISNRLKERLLQAIIHPKVTQLHLNLHDFYNINTEEDGDDVNRNIAVFVWEYIINGLVSLTKLYITNKNNGYTPGIIPNHIVALDIDYCDHLLTVIADTCPALKKLHVRDFKATSVSIQSLQRLMVLEELNIINTSSRLRRYGMEPTELHHFITHLSTCLRTLSFSRVKVLDINQIAKPQLYPDLTSLTVFGMRLSEPISSDFMSLKVLHLWGSDIMYYSALKRIGPQLTTLSFHVSFIPSLEIVAQNCPSLENLTFKCVQSSGTYLHNPEATFASLKTVHLECNKFCSWCLIMKSPKLRSITLCYYREGENNCQNDCLRINQFPDLEVFNACNSLADEALYGLLNVCSTIKVVKGVKSLSIIKDIRMVYPWIHFDC